MACDCVGLSPALARWQNLCLDFYSSIKNFTTSKAEFPALEKVALETPLYAHGLVLNAPPNWKEITLFLKSLPAMVDLMLFVDGAPIPRTLDIIWAQLRTCTLTYCCTTDILHVLPLFSAGTRVCLVDFFEGPERLASVHTVVSDLSIRSRDVRVIDTLLSSLTAPCLKKFCITGRSSCIPHITAFFDRSSCALTHLGVSLWDCGADELTLLTSPHVCDIVDLDVDTQDDPRTFRKATEMLAGRDIMITPKLRRLTLRNCRWASKAVDKIFEIQSNRRPVLQSLWLNRGGLFSQDTLQALKSGGLEVVFFE
ncbi:hypothetical protein GGX14DRAFT_573622 [Mycena pura]|uniref:Uncharacterized protein n=1 Tax=Mycena pura TaxID=153505 RepID=A0AAD6V340_9AGAR|nr:hypothetical protein GGX14DRAFT_573622 [Mycena pura]